MEPMGVLQRILNEIAAQVSQGGVQLHLILSGYLVIFGTFAFAWMLYGMVANGHALQSAIGLMVRLAIVTGMLTIWPAVIGGLQELGIHLGLIATGNQLQITDFLDPGSFVRKGLESGAPMWNAFRNNLGWTTFVVGFAYLGAWLAYCAAFTVMAWKVFWWQVEALLMSLAGLCMIPTLAFRPLAFIGSGTLAYAANMFARFVLGSLLSGMLWTYLDRLVDMARPAGPPSLASLDIQMQTAFVAVGYAWVIAACFFAVNSLAGVLVGGVPGMAGGRTFGGFLRAMGAGAAALMTGGAAAGALAAGSARVGLGAVQGSLGGLAAAQNILAGGSGVRSIGEATRQLYAGVQSGVATREGQVLAQLMSGSAQVMTTSGQRTLQQLMLSNRQTSGRDFATNGVRH